MLQSTMNVYYYYYYYYYINKLGGAKPKTVFLINQDDRLKIILNTNWK